MKKTEKKWYRFVTARRLSELDSMEQKVLFCFWNTSAMVLSSMALCTVCLSFAIGRYENLFYIFLGYLRTREIFLLNWLPVVLLQMFLYALFNRQWAAFLLNGIVALGMSVGNYFKLIYRSDPFKFSDLTSIRAGLMVAGDYDIGIDWRIFLALVFLVVAVLILLLFARSEVRKETRLAIAALVLFSIWPLWKFIYSDSARYYDNSYKNFLFVTRDTRDNYIANGLFYPFLFSITENTNIPPENYSESDTEAVYSFYQNEMIPSDKKINLMAIQLESFCDLEAAGFPGISPQVYTPLRRLQEESISGTMIASVIGGGTVTTERCFLAGTYNQQDYYHPAYSYARYLNGQGYRSFATHPNVSYFYTRETIDLFLGFNAFFGLENHFQNLTDGEWRCDAVYLPEAFRMSAAEAEKGEPVFSFHVSLQGHFPYDDDHYDREDNLWTGEGVSDSTRYMLNNYLSMVHETQVILQDELEKLRDNPFPTVVLIYGDHKPWFGDEVYAELGIPITMENEQGMADYLGTPYLIWANQAAKTILQDDMTGDGPMTSPGYLMNILFDCLGWKGPAFMQFTEEIRGHIPVICTKGGYVEDGVYTQNLSESGRKLLKQYQDMQYYIHYRPELAEKMALD